MIRRSGIALASLLLIAPLASAAETPQEIWVRSKCALCHGMDGSSQTEHGKKTKAPDLRSDAIQKMTDEQLAASISTGHKGMPSFKKQMDTAKVRLLVAYIRGLRK